MDIFLKFGSEKDMNDLLLNGTIYCNPISYFAKFDDGCRFDKNELVVEMNYHENSLLHLIPVSDPNNKITLKTSTLHHKVSIADPTGNIYCLFLVSIDPSLPILNSPFDQRLKEFGTHCVLIHNHKEFFDRIFTHLKSKKINYGNDDVSYRDLTKYTGDKNLFTKGIEYAWQKEWRLFLNTRRNKPYKFKIGNLENIAHIMKTDQIEKMVIFSDAVLFNENKPPL